MTKFTPDKTNHVEDSIPSTHSQSVFELAQQYIALGWKLCALEPGTKSPKTPGWERNPIEPTQIRNRGIGLLHSLSRTCAIDLDNLNDCHYWFYNHNIDLNMLLQDDDAVQIVSGRPNRGKLLYRLPESCAPLQTWQVKGHDKAMLVEFRCVARTGGSQQDVLPPSIHPDTGKPYQWGGNGDFRQLPELPATLLALWNSRPTQTVPTSVQQEIRVIQNSGKIPEGGRNNELFKMGGDLAFNGLSLEAIEAALQVSNQQKCTPPLPRGEVSTIARSVMTSSQGAKLAGVDFSGLMTQVGQQANPSGTGAASQNDEPFTVEQQADYDTLKSAVMAIPTSARLPDSKHDAQTTIGFALSSEYGQTHRGQAAVIAREWDAKTGGRAFDVFTRADPEYADKGGDPVTKNSIFKLAQANGWTDTAKGQPDDDQDLHRNTPKPSPDCLYGLVGDIARAGSENTEANVYAVAMSAIAYMGAAIGRGPYLSIGDDWHHTNGFFLHIGRSARGRKGTAKKLIKRIANAVKNIHESLAPQIHTGGLSSREGLVFLIHDGITQGTITIPPVDDKRLLVIESEFANVLHQSKRDGNTLSPAIRDSWDGTSIKPATKTSRTWATHPHISLMGDITPSELLLLMKSQDFTNGFANRFLMIFAEGEKVNPFPKKTPNETIDYFARRIQNILEFSRANFHKEKDTIEMHFSGDASKRYAALYRGEMRDRSSGERIAALLDRRAPVLLRLAMLFALTDLTTTIELHHINAALAWVRYWTESVKFVFQSAVDEEGAAAVSELAEKILAYLAEKEQATRKELTRDCFSGHASKERIDQALDELLTSAPPKIEVETLPRAKGTTGTATKKYRICANCANHSESHINQHVTGEPFCEPLRTDANHYAKTDKENAETGTVRKGSQQFAEQFATQDIDFVDKSNGSHSSPIFEEKEECATADMEDF